MQYDGIHHDYHGIHHKRKIIQYPESVRIHPDTSGQCPDTIRVRKKNARSLVTCHPPRHVRVPDQTNKRGRMLSRMRAPREGGARASLESACGDRLARVDAA
eukprot:5793214-Prymnesium_polylepis.1